MGNSTLRERLLSEKPEALLKEDKRKNIRDEHSKSYMAAYRKEYSEKNKRVNVTLSNDEFKRVKQLAESNRKKVTSFAKDLLIQEVDKVYLLPEDEKIESLILQIRSIGNNINQLTRHIHRSGFIGPDDVNQLRAALKKIEKVVEGKLSQPDDLLSLVKNEIKTNPTFLSQLVEISKNQDTNKGK